MVRRIMGRFYNAFAKPYFFRQDPEDAHEFAVKNLARLGRLRHALHPYLQPAGPRQRQGPGKGRAAAARDFAAGGILRFLPQARPARPGRLRGKKVRVRPLLPRPILQKLYGGMSTPVRFT